MGRRVEAKAHQAFFTSLLESPEVAAALLHERLLPGTSGLRSRELPEALEGCSFIDEQLYATQTDKLFRFVTPRGRSAYAYCLFEFGSPPGPEIALQLLRSKLRIWDHLEDVGEPLGPIFTLVLYDGRRAWRGPPRFSALFPVDAELQPLLVDFQYAVLDLGAVEDEQLSAHARLRAGLMALKYSTRPTKQASVLEAVLRDSRGYDGLPPAPLNAYLARAWTGIDRARLLEALRQFMPKGGEAPTAAREWVAEGRAEGRVRGWAEGRKEGRVEGREEGRAALRRALQQLLEARFGPVTEEDTWRLAAASLEKLERWTSALLTAASVEEALTARARPGATRQSEMPLLRPSTRDEDQPGALVSVDGPPGGADLVYCHRVDEHRQDEAARGAQ